MVSNAFESVDVNALDLFGSPSTRSETASQFFDRRIRLLQYPKSKSITMILGDTSSGDKTMLTLLMNGEALEVQKSSNNYIVVDKFGLIKKNAALEIPELIIDRERTLNYYVCPWLLKGQSDSRVEILNMHLIDRVFQFAEAVKFVLTIDYKVVSGGSGSTNSQRRDIVEFVSNMIKLMNVNTFSESISLVILNVDVPSDTMDASVLENAANALRLVNNDNQVNSQMKRLIDLLVEQSDNKFYRMACFRRPNQIGNIDDDQFLHNERNNISIVVQRSRMVGKNDDDFGFTLSNSAMNLTPDLRKQFNARITEDITMMIHEIQTIFASQERQISDIRVLNEKMRSAYPIIKQLTSNESISLVEQLVDAIRSLDIHVNAGNLRALLDHSNLLKFLNKVNGQSSTLQLIQPLESLTNYLKQSTLWYDFAVNVYETMSSYRIQKDSKEYEANANRLQQELTVNENAEVNVKYTSIKAFAEMIGIQMDSELYETVVNYIKCKRLKTVLIETMKPLSSTCSSDKLIVKGSMVKISDVNRIECMNKATQVQILATDKLFVDDNIRKSDVEFAFLAATWEVIDEQNFTFMGKNGENYQLPATDGDLADPNGRDGRPGWPGSTPKEYLGIGKYFINDDRLRIETIAGDGGPGQTGGNGMDFEMFSFYD